MPFTTPEARRMTDESGPKEMGDLCFIHYRRMVRRWKASRRWTTAHNIYKELVAQRKYLSSPTIGITNEIEDDVAAAELAWQVFFIKHVMVYENEKCALNGDVE